MTSQPLPLVIDQPGHRPPKPGDKLLTTKQAANLLSLHESSFWRLRQRHPEAFPRPFYLTADPRWSRAEVLEFVFWLRERKPS